MAIACCVVPGVTAGPAHAEPSTPTTLAEVRVRLDKLYHDAEVATEQYNTADVEVGKQNKLIGTLKKQIAANEVKLTRLTALAGAAARAQYRSGGLPAEVQFALAKNPQSALNDASLVQQAQQSTQTLLITLTDTRKTLRTRTDEAAVALKKLEDNRREMDSHRDTIEKQIAQAKQIEAGLAEQQRRELAALEKKADADAQSKWVKTGVLKNTGNKAVGAAAKAIAFATAQLGKPYVWGAVGPDSYDCSGLTSKAWLAAGVPIPRTSQMQWAGLTRVPVSAMQPGDLIIYFSGATHVAIYIGDGEIIHAPRPGRTVTIAPAGSMEILGVVRPGA